MFHLLLALAFSSQPQFIEMDVHISIEGKKLDTIKTLVEAGKKQRIVQRLKEDTFVIEITSKVESEDEVHTAFKILENKKVVSTPHIITFDQQVATVEVADGISSGIELSITPKIL